MTKLIEGEDGRKRAGGNVSDVSIHLPDPCLDAGSPREHRSQKCDCKVPTSSRPWIMQLQGRAKKFLLSLVREVRLCIACLGQWAAVRVENSNMQDFFCTTL